MPDPSRSSPATSTADPLEIPVPGWSPPRPPPTSDQPGPTTTVTDQSPEPDGASDVDSDELHEPSSIPTPGAGRSRAYSGRAATAAELVEPAAAIVGTATLLLNMLHKRRRPETTTPTLWLATEAEAEAMGAPLASIAARHMPITGDDAGDIGDAIAFAGATTAYGVRNMQEAAWSAQPPGWEQQGEQDREPPG